MTRINHTITFNGEIYNYKELRNELIEKGYVFKTEGDTEVLLYAYIAWGEAFLDRLNGMFAFAIWNHQKRSIFFARDIAGEKPFYYRKDVRSNFSFASEAKALDWKCVELPPAHCGTYSLDSKKLKIRQWWTLQKRYIDLPNAEVELDYLLRDAIKIRMRSDVPMALYLSDGVDSNLINTYVPKIPVLTYHDSFQDKKTFLRDIEKIVWHLDYPLDSFSSFGLWQLAQTAKREGIKAILSGEGADELFGGYVRYVPNALNHHAQKIFPSYKNMFPVSHIDLGWADFNGKMRGLLRMGDRMAAAHGIENRCPFLDRRIIEFAYSLPDEYRASGFGTKIILRALLFGKNPIIAQKEKHGLYVSVNEWIGEKDKFSKDKYMKLQQKIWNKLRKKSQ